MTKFTKGPWEVEDYNGYPNIVSPDHGEIIGTEGFYSDPDRDYANANLVAAAPDLYDQVEMYLSLLNALIEDGMIGYIERRNTVASILAKARGEA